MRARTIWSESRYPFEERESVQEDLLNSSPVQRESLKVMAIKYQSEGVELSGKRQCINNESTREPVLVLSIRPHSLLNGWQFILIRAVKKEDVQIEYNSI